MIELIILIISGILMSFVVGWFIMLFFKWVEERESDKEDEE